MAADKHRPHHPAEYAKLLEWAAGSSSILEIGSRFGYTLLDLAHGMNGKGRIVGVDWPGAGDWGTAGSEPILQENVAQLQQEGYDAYLILGDSTAPDIVRRVTDLRPFDFLFIDGDHRYDGALSDWLNYAPMARRVVFHDIVQPKKHENQRLEVWRLWREIKDKYKGVLACEEFVAPDSKMGVGLLRKW